MKAQLFSINRELELRMADANLSNAFTTFLHTFMDSSDNKL